MHAKNLRYGRAQVSLGFPRQVQTLTIADPVCTVAREAFVDDVCRCIGAGKIDGPVAIVVADKTRLCGYPLVLPWVVESLRLLGVADRQITFYIAYGTHPRQSEGECIAAYGETYRQFHFVHHDCAEEKAFISLGETSQGTAVKVRRDVVESELILTVGAVSHHYFAGYGGGRKLLFPGLGEKRAIYANHGLFLDTTAPRLHPGCRPGNLAGNPLAADLEEAHRMLPAYRSVHGILNSHGEPAAFYCGRSYADFLSVCRQLDTYYRWPVDRQFDLLVVSAGGFPKDINFIQTHKSIHNTAPLVRDGGTLLVLAECRDGIGSSTFLPYYQMGGWKEAFAELRKSYSGNGGTALAMMEKTSRLRIAMVTELPLDVCRLMQVEKLSLGEAAAMVNRETGRVGCIDNGSLLVADRHALD